MESMPTKKEAANYLKKSAEAGYARAMYEYATMLKTGDGIPANPAEAERYHQMAIKQKDILVNIVNK